MMSGKEENYLFIGVGGMGMAPLAGWLAQSGKAVCGYDDNLQVAVRGFLEQSGVNVRDFVFAEQLKQFSTVVFSSAISQEHPLLSASREAGIRTLRRGELLAEVSRTKRLIAVAGSHGKTTTSGMIAHILSQHSVSINYILGGLFNDSKLPPSSSVESSDWLLAEVDESDGTIENFEPEVTLLLNTDWDHADRYAQAADSKAAFLGLLKRTAKVVYLPVEDLELATNLKATAQCYTFGKEGQFAADILPKNHLSLSGQFRETQLDASSVGRMNLYNAVAALAVCQQFVEVFKPTALSNFPGMLRRQSILLKQSGLLVVEDYAHHPTEINALVAGLRALEPEHALVIVFQAHRYSRTKQFKHALAKALSEADHCYLLPVYAAHEKPSAGGLTEDFAKVFDGESAHILSMDLQGITDLNTRMPDGPKTVAFVGAGDLDQFARMYVALTLGANDVASACLDYLRNEVANSATVKSDEPLAKKTTLRVGGSARYYAEPANLSELKGLLRAAKLWNLPVFYLGRGSNLVVPDEGFDGLVIRLNAPAWRTVEVLGEGRLWVAAGARLKEICGQAAKAGLGGFEFLEGIPGSVGGSLRMNAGAMGSWIFDIVERVQYLDASGLYLDAPKSAFHFGYRKVEEISHGVALGAIVHSADNDGETDIRVRMDSYSTTRKASQPREPSAGCIFKNPEGNYAGKLIDIHGIKGMRVGAAEVSAKHGNFIVNNGGATASEVIELVGNVREKVYQASGYLLEPEVLLVGKSWESVLGTPLKPH